MSERPADMPKKAWDAFTAHRRNSKRRGIPFLFSAAEWWAWWQIDDRWANRGRGLGKFVMARPGDVGPYSPGNVYCATHDQNARDIPFEVRSAATASAHTRHKHLARRLRVSGEGHPRSRPVITPHGRHGSVALAAAAYGLNPTSARERARKQSLGWRFEDEPERPKFASAKPKRGAPFRYTKPLETNA